MTEQSDVVVEFVHEGEIVGTQEVAGVEDLPATVTFDGVEYATLESSGSGTVAQHSVRTGDDGRATYRIVVVLADAH
jgi:hypothetical protein